ncbi:cation-translocating P-type ATPase [Catellatospora chokoriensis]|uniref:Haloacid dehalogenase n=1 Tax=Catellatospora chokoriensis TaxID=310353 RepID=A0A8J3NVY8_9ACTN|nr:cation-transporting P-type ATPase [Catellatospora chokoriensis]GIF94452.1 haloacid dehalogenase [Catellatospora chokoriensis]
MTGAEASSTAAPASADDAVRAGLTSVQVTLARARAGANAIPASRRPPVVLLLARQLSHFFALLLWAAALLALLAHMPQLSAAIVIVVVVNGVFAFIQEYRADRSVDRLRDLMPAQAVVRRDGHRRQVPATDLVPGDVVLLEAGDRVSADLRAYSAAALAVDESLLTGESVPRRVQAGQELYAGTFVVEGAAEAIVAATGTGTRLAAIAAMTTQTRRPPSPLAVRLARVVRIVAVTAVAAGTVLFGVGLLLGLTPLQGFLFALGVTVALVPEGLLPTVTLALAYGAHAMARRNALVRHLEAVETLGSVTFICTDKTGTLTRNQMSAVRVWTPAGQAVITGEGYDTRGHVDAAPTVGEQVADLAYAAVRASRGRLVPHDGARQPHGDPMEVALHVLALRCGVNVDARAANEPEQRWLPFDPVRLRTASLCGTTLYTKGAPESILADCRGDTAPALLAAHTMADDGLRVLAVARRATVAPEAAPDARDLDLIGVVGLLDPPRPDVGDAIAACRRAHIRLAMITGDHPATARALATQVGLCGSDPLVVTGAQLPADDRELGELVDHDGVVVARVTPEQKLRIARALRARGHAVAMTGDGVNDAPALREADIGIAMGASGSDVARETADLVLLDDHFATIVAAVETGRATFANIRRFLTYHLTDNVAELAPFVVWALSGGTFPLAIGVLQILALDIGTDLLPALALGAEPPNPRTLTGRARTGQLIDRRLLVRVFGVLGPAEVIASLGAFTAVLSLGGWHPGQAPAPSLLAAASGTAFAAIVLGQLANAFACRSETRPAFLLDPRRNRLLLWAVAVELVLLCVFLGVPVVVRTLGGSWPPLAGWGFAALAVPILLLADTAHKAWRGRRLSTGAAVRR